MTPENMFAGGGEMGALMRSHPWPQTPLGPVADWSVSLKTAVDICLSAYFPMVIWWGEDFRLLYNDAFRPILGDRHPQALGQPAMAVFPESWHIIGPQLSSVFATKTANQAENLLIPVLRTGYLEESYYTYSYSPITAKTGEVGGVFTVINETTKQILSDRRLVTLTQLAAQSGTEQTLEEAHASVLRILSNNAEDIPFAALYQLNIAKTRAVLCGRTPADVKALPIPPVLDLAQADPWHFESALYFQDAVTVEDLPEQFGLGPQGVFDLPVRAARVLPVRSLGSGTGLKGITGLLVLGVNPARQIDKEYSAFFNLIVEHVASAIASANNQRTQRALRLSEERLRSFVESDVVGIMFGNTDGRIDDANDEFLRILGYSREDLQAGRLRWADMTPPEYFPADEAGIVEARATGSCAPYEKEYVRKDGSRVPVIVGYTLLGEGQDESVAFVLDVSDRKQIEEALQQRENELQLVTDTVPALISFVDADQRYRFNNRGYEQQLGLSASELYGRHLREVLGETAYARVLPYVERVLAGETVTYEDRLALKDADGTQYFSATYVPRRGANGTVEGFVALISDVSDRKRIEIEKEQLLQREQTAREAAERANRIKDEFLAVISHELRTPLNPILGWSQLLRRKQLSPEKTEIALETIERNAQLQVQLIGDLLDISRILRGKMSLDVQPVELSQVALAALETVRLAAEAKSIQLKTALSACIVAGDAGRLQQIIWNLLSNAVKFTPEAGTVTMTLSAQDSHAIIEVTDTGKGIAPDFLPYVFEHFRQEDYSTTRKFGGLGLGLAIARQLVDLHGGSMSAQSPGEDKGATFTVNIPLAPKADDLPVAEPATLNRDLKGLRVLVVDDEADSREITAFALEQVDFAVIEVDSGEAALQELEKSVPDVLISDIGMPDMDGYTLMAEIRQRLPKEGGQILAIALTAYAGELDFKRAMQAGFQRHVAKPIDPDKLVTIVKEMLSQR
ncbi:MAG: PAS domain S-box protein [Phormidesmis sp.]